MTLVLCEREGPIALLTLNRPDQLNALSSALEEELAAAIASPQVREASALIIRGAGERAFSAGADIKEFLEPPVPTRFREQRKRLDYRGEMDRCPQPIIAAIRGFALGGGLELALACDIRIAAEDAQLGLTEVNLGIIPGGGGTQRLPRVVGRGKALEMILTGARMTADEALRIGLVERVVPAALLIPAALALARAMADKAPIALRYAKEAVVSGLQMSLADGLRLENDLSTLLRTTEDRAEGARAFVEKRKPKWSGQ